MDADAGAAMTAARDPALEEGPGDDAAIAHLAGLMRQGPFVAITGAGLSTASGIPAYRDQEGRWRHPRPVQHQDFLRQDAVRRRYWARSFVGWRTMGHAAPNAGHVALAALQRAGFLSRLITQNVDGLHQRAGSEGVIELHGGIARVRCLTCDAVFPRSLVQDWLTLRNAGFADRLRIQAQDGAARAAPDGDAHLQDDAPYADFQVPPCPDCAGLLKPDVVFFGDNVPRGRVALAMDAVADAAGLLVVGSSLMVYSGFRFAEMAHRMGKPVVALNQGLTRADALLARKIDADCVATLKRLVQALP